MSMSPDLAKLILDLYGENVLKRAVSKDDSALVDRIASMLEIADELKIRRANVAALIKDFGIDKAERALLILADGSPPDALKRRKQTSAIEMALKSQPVPASESLVSKLVKGK